MKFKVGSRWVGHGLTYHVARVNELAPMCGVKASRRPTWRPRLLEVEGAWRWVQHKMHRARGPRRRMCKTCVKKLSKERDVVTRLGELV